MAATLDATVYNFSYGTMPTDFNELQPKFCVINGQLDASANYDVDLSEYVNRDMMGNIQTVIMSIIHHASTAQLDFIFGGSNIQFSVNAFAGGNSAKCIFPYLAPRDAMHHRLRCIDGVSTIPFQLVFTNIALPIVAGGYSSF